MIFMLEGSLLALDPMITLPNMGTCSLSYKKDKIPRDPAKGEEAFALGVGSIYVRFPGTNYIYVISPIYWVPNNTSNTFFSQAMKLSTGFNSDII